MIEATAAIQWDDAAVVGIGDDTAIRRCDATIWRCVFIIELAESKKKLSGGRYDLK